MKILKQDEKHLAKKSPYFSVVFCRVIKYFMLFLTLCWSSRKTIKSILTIFLYCQLENSKES